MSEQPTDIFVYERKHNTERSSASLYASFITLTEGAPVRLTYEDEGAENWQIYDNAGTRLELVRAYDAEAHTLTMLAKDYRGGVIFPLVEYQMEGHFTVRMSKLHPLYKAQ